MAALHYGLLRFLTVEKWLPLLQWIFSCDCWTSVQNRKFNKSFFLWNKKQNLMLAVDAFDRSIFGNLSCSCSGDVFKWSDQSLFGKNKTTCCLRTNLPTNTRVIAKISIFGASRDWISYYVTKELNVLCLSSWSITHQTLYLLFISVSMLTDSFS